MPEINNNDVSIMNEIDTKEPPKEKEEQPKIPNKFFNFLEDEAANMTMNIEDDNNESVFVNDSINDNIEVLDMNENSEINPLLFDINDGDISENNIEEIIPAKEEIVDPIDRIDTLEPNYEEEQKQQNGKDLKTAINNIRDVITNLENNGFAIVLEEIDLEDSYQITINIKK